MSEWYTVQPGDYMELIAEHFGFRDHHLIYDDAANVDFKKRRPNPDILLPGDSIFIPDKDPGHDEAETDKKHKFVLKSEKIKLILYVRRAGKPLAGRAYTLKVGKLVVRSTTGSDGLIQHEIPIGEPEGELTISGEPAYKRKLSIGFLHPITTVSGVQMRLNNLGFACGPATETDIAPYHAALAAYQTKHSLPSRNGNLDDATVNALRSEYDKGIAS